VPAGWAARTPVRVMTRHYSNYHTRINKRWHVRLDQMCTALCHRVIAVSEHTAEHMRRDEGAPADRLRVIYNGIDFDRIKVSAPEAPAALRQEYAPNGEFLLLQVGRLHPEKGYEHLFRAMQIARSRTPRPLRLLVAGWGPLMPHYQEMLNQLGVDDIVTLLGFRKDVPDLMAAADALVLASVAEAFGYVLAEALYMGTPVLATQVGGIPEVVDHEVSGLLVPPASPEELADGIVRLAQDGDLRRQLAGAGRQKVIEKFGFPQMVREYEALYDDALAGGARRTNASRLGDRSHV
jgi:glycosyltransferase involved in cell wall biosynthesis